MPTLSSFDERGTSLVNVRDDCGVNASIPLITMFHEVAVNPKIVGGWTWRSHWAGRTTHFELIKAAQHATNYKKGVSSARPFHPSMIPACPLVLSALLAVAHPGTS